MEKDVIGHICNYVTYYEQCRLRGVNRMFYEAIKEYEQTKIRTMVAKIERVYQQYTPMRDLLLEALSYTRKRIQLYSRMDMDGQSRNKQSVVVYATDRWYEFFQSEEGKKLGRWKLQWFIATELSKSNGIVFHYSGLVMREFGKKVEKYLTEEEKDLMKRLEKVVSINLYLKMVLRGVMIPYMDRHGYGPILSYQRNGSQGSVLLYFTNPEYWMSPYPVPEQYRERNV